MILKYHPDKAGAGADNNEKFAKVREAFDILSHPDKRHNYNQQRSKETSREESEKHKTKPKHGGRYSKSKDTVSDNDSDTEVPFRTYSKYEYRRPSHQSDYNYYPPPGSQPGPSARPPHPRGFTPSHPPSKESRWVTRHFRRIERKIDLWIERVSSVKYFATLVYEQYCLIPESGYSELTDKLLEDALEVTSRFRNAVVQLSNDVLDRTGTSSDENKKITNRYLKYTRVIEHMEMILYDVEEIVEDLDGPHPEKKRLGKELEHVVKDWLDLHQRF